MYLVAGLCVVFARQGPLASLQQKIRSRRLQEACDPGDNGTVDDDGNCVCNEGFKTDGVGCLPDVSDEENRRRLQDEAACCGDDAVECSEEEAATCPEARRRLQDAAACCGDDAVECNEEEAATCPEEARRLQEACDPGDNGTVDDDGNCVCNEGFKTDGVGCLPDVSDEENRRRLSELKILSDFSAAVEQSALRRLGSMPASDKTRLDAILGELVDLLSGETDSRRRLDEEAPACCADESCGEEEAASCPEASARRVMRRLAEASKSSGVEEARRVMQRLKEFTKEIDTKIGQQ